MTPLASWSLILALAFGAIVIRSAVRAHIAEKERELHRWLYDQHRRREREAGRR